jgi:pantothenate kinase
MSFVSNNKCLFCKIYFVHTSVLILIHVSVTTCIYIHITIINEICNLFFRGHHGRDRIVVGFTTTYAINAYHH